MIYGYARVSTAGQDLYGNGLESQIEQLKEAGAQIIYKEHFTGTTMDRPEFDKLRAALKPGDWLVVAKLDRIARTASKGYEAVKDLLDEGVSVHVLNIGLIDNSPTGRLMLHVMLAFAEFERDMIVQRTTEGKEIARQKPGFKEGRPALPPEIRRGIQIGKSWADLGISRAAWYKYRKMADA